MTITKDSENLYSSMRFVGDGVTKRVPLTFDLREGDGLAVDFGEGLVTSGYLIDYDVTPVVVLFSEPLPLGKTITIRRLTKIDTVKHVFQWTGNAQGGADFSAKNVDENFEQITRASQDAMDSQTLATETLEDMAGIRDEALDAKESAKESADKAKEYEQGAKTAQTEANKSALRAGASAQLAKDSELKAKAWATNPEDVEVEDDKYSAMHWAMKAKDFSGIDFDPTEYRKKDDLLFKGMMQVQATDDVGTGVFLLDKEGVPRGQMTHNSGGLQFAQVQDDGSAQAFTFPRYGEGGEILLDDAIVEGWGDRNNATLSQKFLSKEIPNEINKVNKFNNSNDVLNTVYGNLFSTFKIPYNQSSQNGFIQSLHYDLKSNRYYAITVTDGKVGSTERTQIKVFDGAFSRESEPLFKTASSEVCGHQGIGILNGRLIASKGSIGSSKADSFKVIATQIPTEEGQKLTIEKEWIVWSVEDNVRNGLANSVAISNDSKYVVVSGLDDDTQRGGVNKKFRIRVFKSDLFIEDNSNLVGKEVVTFNSVTPVTTENYWILQGTAVGNGRVYLMCSNMATNFHQLQVYTLSGDHVASYDTEIGRDSTNNMSVKYYEPEGLCWLPTGVGLSLGCAVVGGYTGGWGSETRFNFITSFTNKRSNYTNIEVDTDVSLRLVSNDYENSPVINAVPSYEGTYDLVLTSRRIGATRAVLRGTSRDGAGSIYSNSLTMELGNDTVGKANVFIASKSWYSTRQGGTELGTTVHPFSKIFLKEQPAVTSDMHKKDNISAIDNKWFEVLELMNFKQYTFKDESTLHFGIIAQDWIKACNDVGVDPFESSVLTGSEEEGYAVRYGELQNLFNAYILTKIK